MNNLHLPDDWALRSVRLDLLNLIEDDAVLDIPLNTLDGTLLNNLLNILNKVESYIK